MKKKFLLGLCSFLLMGALSSCSLNKDPTPTPTPDPEPATPTLTGITASLKDSKEYQVGETIIKSAFEVKANYSDNSSETVNITKWTSNVFTTASYTFVVGDVGQKEFDFKYLEKTTTCKVTVKVGKPIVTFNSNGGSAVNSIEVEKGGKVTKPTDPTKAENTFVNWYTDEGFTNVYDFNTEVNSSFTLHAKWLPNKINVTVDQSTTDCTTYLDPNDYPATVNRTDTTFNIKIKQARTGEDVLEITLIATEGSFPSPYYNPFYDFGHHDTTTTGTINGIDFGEVISIKVTALIMS